MSVSPDSCAALVLNADFRPLSYFPLSLWPWQETIKAVFLDRVNIVSQYERVVRSPSFEMRLPSVIALNPVTGENHTYIANVHAAIDMECAARPAPNNPSFFVMEYSVNQGASPLPPGRVMRYDSPNPTVWLEGITTPVSLALDESTGTAYIVSRADGKILRATYR
jgi:hypothetical protein